MFLSWTFSFFWLFRDLEHHIFVWILFWFFLWIALRVSRQWLGWQFTAALSLRFVFSKNVFLKFVWQFVFDKRILPQVQMCHEAHISNAESSRRIERSNKQRVRPNMTTNHKDSKFTNISKSMKNINARLSAWNDVNFLLSTNHTRKHVFEHSKCIFFRTWWKLYIMNRELFWT